MQTDRKVEGGATETRSLAFDPFGCIRSITKEAIGTEPNSAMSEYTCGLDGRVVARATTKPDGSRSRRIDVAGIGEIRPDEGVFVIRVPVAGSVTVEDARLLSDGTRAVSLSGYLVNDARGSVLATTAWDSDTVITREAEYDAWGQKLAGYSALTSPRHGFGGAEADAAAGTYTFGARTYDPTLRRWVSPDPLLAALPSIDLHVGDSLNLYGYADGNPVKHTDPSGYSPVCAVAAFVAACVIVGVAMGAAAPSDTKDAPANVLDMMVAVPGPAVVAKAAEGVLARIAEASAPRFAGFVRAFLAVEGKAGITAAKAEAAAPAAQAAKKGAEGAAQKVETTVAQDAAKSGGSNHAATGAGPKPNNGNAKPHGSPTHNAAIDQRVQQLKQDKDVSNIRKNQAQVDVNGNKVGRNRPDVQYDKDRCHHCVEYDHDAARSAQHGKTIRANDPNTKVELNKL